MIAGMNRRHKKKIGRGTPIAPRPNTEKGYFSATTNTTYSTYRALGVNPPTQPTQYIRENRTHRVDKPSMG